MYFFVAGGCGEHGRNCFMIEGVRSAVLLDCGLMKEKPGVPFPMLTMDAVQKVDYLILSHCHLDHAGALLWLYEQGFRGRVIATAFTLAQLPGRVSSAIVLDEETKPGEWKRIDNNLHLMWGRSGHCLGSVWVLLELEGRRIFYSGDYTEHSAAYRVDKVRDTRADLAIIDAAYGEYARDGKINREVFSDFLDSLVEERRPLLFPVPGHGRGLDIMRMLAERGIPMMAEPRLLKETGWALDHPRWMRKGFISHSQVLGKMKTVSEATPEALTEECCGILVADTSMKKKLTARLEEAVKEKGGRVVVTGKQLPGSRSRQMVDNGEALFLRLSVHQNREELERLAAKNRFDRVVPFHCRDLMKAKDPRVLSLVTGQSLEF